MYTQWERVMGMSASKGKRLKMNFSRHLNPQAAVRHGGLSITAVSKNVKWRVSFTYEERVWFSIHPDSVQPCNLNIHPEICWGRLKLRHLNKIFSLNSFLKWYSPRSCSRFIRDPNVIVNFCMLCWDVAGLWKLSVSTVRYSVGTESDGGSTRVRSVEQKNCLT